VFKNRGCLGIYILNLILNSTLLLACRPAGLSLPLMVSGSKGQHSPLPIAFSLLTSTPFLIK
jgi:hypothetical protein